MDFGSQFGVVVGLSWEPSTLHSALRSTLHSALHSSLHSALHSDVHSALRSARATASFDRTDLLCCCRACSCCSCAAAPPIAGGLNESADLLSLCAVVLALVQLSAGLCASALNKSLPFLKRPASARSARARASRDTTDLLGCCCCWACA